MVQNGTSELQIKPQGPPAKALHAQPAELQGTADIFPLSVMQESLWLTELLTPGSSAYNLVEAWRLRGRLDLPALQQSLTELVVRHETLRTIFFAKDGKSVQVILPPRPLTVQSIDVRQSPEPEGEVRRLLADEARRPFELTRGPLVRVSLFKVAEAEHVLFLNLHHIISDEWSFGILLRELAAGYEANLSGRALHLPELPIQYADFAVWQRESLAADGLKTHLTYWREQLRGPLPRLDLPTDHPLAGVMSGRGATEFFSIPKALLKGMETLSRETGATVFMILLAAFKLLLLRYTRQQDIIVGSPFAGRTRVETEGLIGYFIHTHALRTDLGGDPTFPELLRRVRETVLGAYAHQELPVDLIVAALAPEREAGRHPLFQVVFGWQTAFTEKWPLAGLTTSRVELDNGGSKFDLTLLLTEHEGGIRVRCEYNTDLFEPGTMVRMNRQFQTLLESIMAQPERRLSEYSLLSDPERFELLTRWNQQAVEEPPGRCLPEWFEKQVERAPEAIALVCGPERLTYRELNSKANQLAHHLVKLGVGPESLVVLHLDRSVNMIIAILGVLKAGGAYVPLDPGYPKERLSYMLADTKASVILTQKALSSSLPATSGTLVCLDSAWHEISSCPAINYGNSRPSPQNAAYVIYTSGSTGKPKGVVVTHQNVVRLFQKTESWYGFGPADVWSLFHSYAFDFSVWEMWGALLYGGRLVIVPYLVSRSPGEFYELLVTEMVTVLNQTPSAFRQLIWAENQTRRSRQLSLRYIIFGGEALELQMLKPWFQRHGDQQPQLVNMYGITETTVHVTYRVIREPDLDAGAGSVIGMPIPDLRLYVLDEHLQPVPIGVPGEICVGGEGVARGYLNRPELNCQRFIPDPFGGKPGARLYRSGDLARYTGAGELVYLGRIDDQIKIRGFRVEIGEIESALNRHPSLRETAVIAQENAAGDKCLVAYVVAKKPAPTNDELRQYLTSMLPVYMIPGTFVQLTSLPLTPHGKVDRRALPKPGPASAGGAHAHVAPRNETEERIAAVWCEVLGLAKVGVHDNFFHVGGHSLVATQVISRLSVSFGRELSVRLLFESPTVAQLAGAILDSGPGPAGGTVVIRRRVQPEQARQLLARLDELTEDEIDDLLGRKAAVTTVSV